MKLFLDSADVTIIEQYKNTYLIDGITTNPTSLSKEQKKPHAIITSITELLPLGDISVEVTEQLPDKMYKQAREIAHLAPNICVKIPCHQDYYSIIKQLVSEGIALNVTLVFSLFQALAMAKLGVRYISVFVGRWDAIGTNGAQQIYDIMLMLQKYQFTSQLLVASVRTPRHVHEAIMAGAHAITLPPSLFATLITHPLTNQGIEIFMQDWQASSHQTFP
ncbi:MAG: transaldolase family protein [Candidatus Babeliales bacterium]